MNLFPVKPSDETLALGSICTPMKDYKEKS